MKIYKHKGKKYIREGSCKCCGQCCRDLAIETEMEVNESNGKSKHLIAKELKEKERRDYEKQGYKNIEIGRVTWLNGGKEIKFTVELDCSFLKNNKCTIQGTKPKHCIGFPTPDVEKPKWCGYKFKKRN